MDLRDFILRYGHTERSWGWWRDHLSEGKWQDFSLNGEWEEHIERHDLDPGDPSRPEESPG